MLGPLEAGHVVQARGVQLDGRDRLAGHHKSHHHLAPFGIGPANHRHLADLRMGQQHLFDLARVDVGAAADDQVLGAVEQRQVAVVVQPANVAGGQPAATDGAGRGLGVAPVASHDQFAAHTDLAHFADRQSLPLRITHRQFDHRLCMPHRGQALPVTRVAGVKDVAARQHSDRHRAFALAVDLRKVRPDHLQRLLDVGQVHGPTAIDDGGQPLRPPALLARDIDQPVHHGGRGKEGGFLPVRGQRQAFGGIKALAARHHVQTRLQHIGQVVPAAAV